MGSWKVRCRALVPMTKLQSWIASSSVLTMVARSNKSTAPAARLVASSEG